MPSCIQWGEERHQECSQTEDQGYNDCCNWWPCSWACDAWVWVSNIVCVGWTWVTTAGCVAWDVVTTGLNAFLVTAESTLGWGLSAIAFVVELILAIPMIGTLIRWVLNGTTHIVFIAAGLIDAGLGLIGIRPEKKLRICTVILRDENGSAVVTVDFAKALLQLAVNVYKRDANVRIMPLGPFKYSTGFADAETVDDSWVIVDGGSSDSTLLDVPCDLWADWLGTGMGFQFKSSTLCFFGSWRRVVGYGAPVSCFIIRSPGAGVVLSGLQTM